MGLRFGELRTIRGIVYYKLSQFEQKTFAGMLTRGGPNLIRRFRDTFLTWLPPFVGAYFLIKSIDAKHRQSLRKNPEDYIDEVDPDAATLEASAEASAAAVKKRKC